jgi:cell division protein ZapA
MSKVTVKLYGKDYSVNCDPGQEERLKEIVRFVESRMRDVADRVGNTTEPRLLMLTCLHIADELFDARRKAEEAGLQNEDLLVAAVEHLSQRVSHIATQVGRA